MSFVFLLAWPDHALDITSYYSGSFNEARRIGSHFLKV
jgi:hypothetical protein